MTDPLLRPLRSAQVGMLFRSVGPGVSAATVGAALLASTVSVLSPAPAATSALWALAITVCTLCHLALKWGYDRASRPLRNRWRPWAVAYCTICLAEGCGWGWASIALAPADRFDLQLLVMLVCYGVGAGGILAFGSYMPAYWLLLIPSTCLVPIRYLSDGRLEQGFTAAFAVLFIVAVAAMAVRFNGELNNILRLGFEKDELTARLVQEKERAEEANRAKSRFLAAASHDLRQPVHALSLFVGALQSAEMSEQARGLVGHIEGSVIALDSLFGALLNISQLDANIVSNTPRSFPVLPLLERISRDYATGAAAKGLALRLHPCSLSVHADPVLLERVLRNLVSNAVRHTRRGRVVMGCRRSGGVRIEVWDTGPGIPAAMQNRVFEEFFQLANPERDRAQGLGLGLAIVRRVAMIMGAALTIRSIPGQGSMFGVTVPRGVDDPQAAKPPGAPAMPRAGHGLILVVDDERAIQTAMQMLLRSWGYDVITAGSAAEMLGHVADCAVRPVLLICDYRLRGGEDGITAVRRLQDEYNGDLPAMLVTGDTAPERLQEAEESGLLLLHKPVTEPALRAAIAHLTAREAGPPGATAAAWLAAPG